MSAEDAIMNAKDATMGPQDAEMCWKDATMCAKGGTMSAKDALMVCHLLASNFAWPTAALRDLPKSRNPNGRETMGTCSVPNGRRRIDALGRPNGRETKVRQADLTAERQQDAWLT